MQIAEIDIRDATMRRAFYAVEQDVIRHDLPHGWQRSLESFEQSVLQPDGPYRRTVRLAALDEAGACLGTAEVGLSLADNLHLAEVEVAVTPGARGVGVGRRLLERVLDICQREGRTTLCGEVDVREGVTLEQSAAHRLSAPHGFVSVHQEDHLVLDLPVQQDLVDRLTQVAVAADYDIVVWGERCPDEYVADYCAMRTQMNADVPTGEIDAEPVILDQERLRVGESRTAKGWIPIVAAARRRKDGVMGGYSMIMLPRGGYLALQDDTLVMPEHRGHRLGTALKLATLDVVRRDHPDRTAIHTWTEPENHAMQRTNADFGFLPRSRMHELQRME